MKYVSRQGLDDGRVICVASKRFRLFVKNWFLILEQYSPKNIMSNAPNWQENTYWIILDIICGVLRTWCWPEMIWKKAFQFCREVGKGNSVRSKATQRHSKSLHPLSLVRWLLFLIRFRHQIFHLLWVKYLGIKCSCPYRLPVFKSWIFRSSRSTSCDYCVYGWSRPSTKTSGNSGRATAEEECHDNGRGRRKGVVNVAPGSRRLRSDRRISPAIAVCLPHDWRCSGSNFSQNSHLWVSVSSNKRTVELEYNVYGYVGFRIYRTHCLIRMVFIEISLILDFRHIVWKFQSQKIKYNRDWLHSLKADSGGLGPHFESQNYLNFFKYLWPLFIDINI